MEPTLPSFQNIIQTRSSKFRKDLNKTKNNGNDILNNIYIDKSSASALPSNDHNEPPTCNGLSNVIVTTTTMQSQPVESMPSDLSAGASLLELLKRIGVQFEVNDTIKRKVRNYLKLRTKKELMDILVQILGLKQEEKTRSENHVESNVEDPEAIVVSKKKRARKSNWKSRKETNQSTGVKVVILKDEVQHSAKPLKKRPCFNNNSVKEVNSSNYVPDLEVQVEIEHQSSTFQTFDCKTCNLSFTRRSVYRKHLQAHASSMKCDICDKIFKSKDSLYHHQRGLHGKEKPYHCNVCDSYFSFHHSYKLHLQRHKGERPFSCKLCPKTYLTSSHLKEHMRAVHLDSSIICHVCGKKFSYNSALKLHLQIHVDDTTYSCLTCNKEFNTKRALKRHSVHHLENKRVKCNVCRKYFKSDHYLNIHSKLHSNKFDKSYRCDTCGKSFFYKCILESHVQTHNKIRSFVCVICNKAFKSKASLYSHKYVHNEGLAYLCTICSKSFKTKSCLNAHTKRHKNQSTFVCSTCGKTFPDKGGLSKHTKTVHLPSKYYSCKICERTGTRADNMRTHVKSHRNQVGPSDDPMSYILCVEDAKSDSSQVCHSSISKSSHLLESGSSLLLPSTMRTPSELMCQKESNFTPMKSDSSNISNEGDYRYRNLPLSIPDNNFNTNYYPTGISESNSSSFTTILNVVSDVLQGQSCPNSSFDKFSSNYHGQYIPVGNVEYSGNAQTKAFGGSGGCGVDWLTAPSSQPSSSGVNGPVE